MLVGTFCAWSLTLTLHRVFWDYVLYPRLKAADGYIYPQWRYAAYNAVFIAWCLVGVLTSITLLRNVSVGRAFDGFASRFTLTFFAGLAVLIVGAVVGVWLRSQGF